MLLLGITVAVFLFRSDRTVSVDLLNARPQVIDCGPLFLNLIQKKHNIKEIKLQRKSQHLVYHLKLTGLV